MVQNIAEKFNPVGAPQRYRRQTMDDRRQTDGSCHKPNVTQ